MTERRRFLQKAAGAATGVAVTVLADAPNVIAQPKVQWRMPTTWTPALDVLQGAAEHLAKVVGGMTSGRFRIVVSPSGQIVPPEECFNAASKGEVEAFMGSTVQWPAKDAALPWFTTIPFGMNPQGMLAWFYQGDGLKLWEETYAAYNLVPRPGPEVAPQMAGWFRKKITTIGDFKGFKMRIPGLGGKVLAKAGATTVTIPAADIYASLERGT
jgi:TRAP-type mannitol/chloroaromatic compound transport system substrate-binding protein